MLGIGKVQSGEVWSSGRSGSIYFDLDLGEGGDLTVRLDDDGTWFVDVRETAEGKLRDLIVAEAARRGVRGGVRRMTCR
jgi:hypothetical protein